MIEQIQTILSFSLAIFMGLSFFIADPANPNKWEIEIDARRRQSKTVDGYTPLNLPDSILKHLPNRKEDNHG